MNNKKEFKAGKIFLFISFFSLICLQACDWNDDEKKQRPWETLVGPSAEETRSAEEELAEIIRRQTEAGGGPEGLPPETGPGDPKTRAEREDQTNEEQGDCDPDSGICGGIGDLGGGDDTGDTPTIPGLPG